MVETRTRGRPVSLLLLLFCLAFLVLAGCARRQDPTPLAGDPATAPPGATAAAGRDPTAAASEAGPGLLPGRADATDVPDVGAAPEATAPPQVYVVQPGDTLGGIARRFGYDVQSLIEANGLADPNALQVGQSLRFPPVDNSQGPAGQLLPNSEFVYGPAYADFDTAAFARQKGGYLAGYSESVGGRTLTGPEIVDLVAHHYSVGPRLLLAIMELRSGWVTNPGPTGASLSLPMGYNGSGWESLNQQLAWAADELNQGYYDWRGRGISPLTWPDGTVMRYPATLNAATAGLQRFFSLGTGRAQWEVLVGEGPGSFGETYRSLFGDPARHAVEPLVPAGVADPGLSLPWADGELWFYTGGPHGAWNEGSAWAAVDFVPDEGYLGCQAAAAWARAAAPGLVVYSQNGEVALDLDGDGHEQTGWVLFYLHLATEGRVPAGTRLERGDPVGHPSCEGGFSESTHLHFARKFNGEWIAADGPLPLLLSGWQFYSAGAEYDGTATRGRQERTACECREAGYNGLLGDDE